MFTILLRTPRISKIPRKVADKGNQMVEGKPPAEEPAPEVEEDVPDSAAESVAAESVAGDFGDDELAASSQSKSKKVRVLSSLTEKGQEDVALFLERNDFIYNMRRTDHTLAS